MNKIYTAVTIIAISIVPTFLAGCAAISDDIARIVAKPVSNAGDDLVRQVPKKKIAVATVVPMNANQNKLLNKCSQQAGKSAVLEAWQRVNSSGSQVSENYLFGVARDAIQKCTVGKVGDRVLDELAHSTVGDFKQEYPRANLQR
jgi:hypothetical protein